MSIEQEARRRVDKILENSQVRLGKDEIGIRAFIDCADWILSEVDKEIGRKKLFSEEVSILRSFICNLTD